MENNFFAEQELKRYIYYKSFIDSRRSNKLTFFADDECKAEILEILREDNHKYKIVEVDEKALTVEII